MQIRAFVCTGRHRFANVFLYTALIVVSILSQGCQKQSDQTLHGYAEGEFVLVAAPTAGRLETLAVRRGDQIRADELLFVLERDIEQAQVTSAEQDVLRITSKLEDLSKGLRPSELEAIRSRLDQVRAALTLSQKEFERRKTLLARSLISVEEFDRAKSDLERNQAALAEVQAQLQTASLGARSDTVAVAQAELEAARARLDQALWYLNQKSQYTRQDALVFDTFFEPGEFVPAGAPIVSLLPPGNIKLLFFVPEPLVGTLQIGQPVGVSFDGSAGNLRAAISYISPRAAYTPPVIYSRESRAKLVFEVEARPAPGDATRFHPGQPVDVSLE